MKNRPIALPFAAVNRVVTCTELAMAPVPAEASAVKEPHGAVEQPAVPLHTPRTISAWFKTGAEAGVQRRRRIGLRNRLRSIARPC